MAADYSLTDLATDQTLTRADWHRGAGTTPPPSRHRFADDGHGACCLCGRRKPAHRARKAT